MEQIVKLPTVEFHTLAFDTQRLAQTGQHVNASQRGPSSRYQQAVVTPRIDPRKRA